MARRAEAAIPNLASFLTAGERAAGLTIDDGLIRSVGASGAVAVSLLVEPAGDLTPGRSRRLEALLEAAGWETPALLAEAESLMAFKRREGLSRFNAGRRPAGDCRQPCVLVVGCWRDGVLFDQGAAAPQVWTAMLAAARAENPGAEVVVLHDGARPVFAGPASPDADVMALIEAADAVYTVGSLVGLEAVLLGRRVVCFGAPFYAGRGLTEDRAPVPARRKRSRSELFAAAYLMVPRYADPLTGQACAPRLAFERLAAFRRHARRVAGDWVGLNIPPAKARVVKAFLSGPMSTFRATGAPGPSDRLLAWASRPNEAVRRAMADAPGRLVWIEDGFIRSVGLGASFFPASSLALDEGGIYFDPSSGSDLARMLNTTEFDAGALAAAGRLREDIVALGLTKYNLAAGAPDFPPSPGRRRILVPGQVENDASVLRGGGAMSNQQLLARVRADNPRAFIVYKEHPDVTAGIRPGALADGGGCADLCVRDADILSCIAAVDEVHTLTSLAGFEALLRGKPVTAYGWPFYAGWGLTRDRGPMPAPVRRPVSLEALVAAALMVYPLYLDPVAWLPCDAATFLQRLGAQAEGRDRSIERRAAGPWRRGANALKLMLRPPAPPAY